MKQDKLFKFYMKKESYVIIDFTFQNKKTKKQIKLLSTIITGS